MRLYGNPIFTLRQMIRNGPIPLARIPLALAFLIKSILSYPFQLIEYLHLSHKLKTYSLPKDPIFILGHYRSGTTLLYKLLMTDPQWGYVSDFNLILPQSGKIFKRLFQPVLQSLIRVLGIKHPYFNNYLFKLDDPNEDEGLLISMGSPIATYWGFLYPKNAHAYLDKYIHFTNAEDRKIWKKTFGYFIKKLSFQQNGKTLMLKSPPHTARIKVLLELYPNARFVYIYRNPYHVYYSMYALLKNVVEKNFSLQKQDHENRKELVFSHYTQLLTTYQNTKDLIPEGQLMEIKYEELKKDPLNWIQKTFQQLSLPGFEEAKPFLQARIKSEQTYKKFSYDINKETNAEIYQRWGPFIDSLGYK